MLTTLHGCEEVAIASPVTAVVGSDDVVSLAVAHSLDTGVLDAAAPLPGGVDGVVVVTAADVGPAPLADLNAAEWQRFAHGPIWQTIDVFQRAYAAMRDRGGRLVLVAPTVGMAGSPRLVAYTTAVEGIRAMAKSAARQWSDHGVGVNIIGVPVSLLATQLADADAHLTAPAVADGDGDGDGDGNGDGDGLLDDVVAAVSFLLRRDVGHLVGQTIVVDGGSVMLP